MRERLDEWAPYFGAVGVALWFTAGLLFLLGTLTNERLVALVVVGVVLVGLYVYLRPDQVRDLLTSRGARYGSNALLLSIAFIGIVGVLNFMGARYHWREDLTANKSFTLSPLTVQVLKDLKVPVQATAFFTARMNRQEIQDRLKEYSNQTNLFTFRFVDPEAEPEIARDYKIQFDGSVVMERGTRRENVFGADEQSLTNAVLKVSQDTQPTVYFTTGHGEHSPVDNGENGLDLMKGAMEGENYKVAVLDLKTVTETLPSDITALIIAGPRQPFEPAEAKLVKDYLDKNGRVMVMLDPQVNSGLDSVLEAWGLRARNDLVYDPKSGFFGQAQTPAITTYPSHQVTQDLAGMGSFFPAARSVAADASPTSERTATALLTTSDASWGETNFDSVKSQAAKYDEGADAKGPLTLAYAVQASGEKPARLVVVGNASFITNGTLNTRITVGGQQARVQSGNALFFGNSLHWLAGQENLIAIPPKAPDQQPIFLDTAQTAFLAASTILMLPGAILIIGLLVWLRRR